MFPIPHPLPVPFPLVRDSGRHWGITSAFSGVRDNSARAPANLIVKPGSWCDNDEHDEKKTAGGDRSGGGGSREECRYLYSRVQGIRAFRARSAAILTSLAPSLSSLRFRWTKRKRERERESWRIELDRFHDSVICIKVERMALAFGARESFERRNANAGKIDREPERSIGILPHYSFVLSFGVFCAWTFSQLATNSDAQNSINRGNVSRRASLARARARAQGTSGRELCPSRDDLLFFATHASIRRNSPKCIKFGK